MVAEVLRERSCALRGRSASGTPKVVIEHMQDAFTGEITLPRQSRAHCRQSCCLRQES